MSTSKLLSSLFLVTALAVTGCQKSPDLGRMQDETLAIVKMHGAEVEILQRRSEALMARGRNVSDAPGVAEAGRVLSEANTDLKNLRAQLAAAPATLGDAVKKGTVDEVQRASDEVIEKLDRGQIAVKANLAAVEGWVVNAENRTLAMVPPPPAPPPVDETPAPPPTPAPGAGAGSPPAGAQ